MPGTHAVFVGAAINCARTRRDEMKDAPTISDRRRLKRTQPAGERAAGRTPETSRWGGANRLISVITFGASGISSGGRSRRRNPGELISRGKINEILRVRGRSVSAGKVARFAASDL